MPSTVTVTGTAGPGLTATAVVTTNVTRVEFDTTNEVITIFSDGNAPRCFSISAATTLIFTVVAPNNYTLTIT